MFQVGDRHSELIFSLLTTKKWALCEFKNAMIQVLARQCDLICFLLTSPKRDLG